MAKRIDRLVALLTILDEAKLLADELLEEAKRAPPPPPATAVSRPLNGAPPGK